MYVNARFKNDEAVDLCRCPVLKKVKHRVVENMNSGTADALGLSRAILCNGELIGDRYLVNDTDCLALPSRACARQRVDLVCYCTVRL